MLTLIGRTLMLLWTALAFASPVSAEFVDGEAFGIRMGTPTADLDVGFMSASADPSIRLYALRSVPKPHPSLDTYYMHSGDKAGACSVIGDFASRSADRADELEKRLLDELKGNMGEPEIEYYPVTSTLLEAWKKALGHSDLGPYPNNQRIYTWKRDALTRRISLARWLPSPNTLVKPGYLEHRISVTFEFRNYEDCVREGQEGKRRPG